MDLLTPEQQKTYSSAIRKGYFATYDGYRWRHEFYGAFIWKHPGRVKVVDKFKQVIGRAPLWEDITDDNLRDVKEELDASYAPNSVRTIFDTFLGSLRLKATVANSGTHWLRPA